VQGPEPGYLVELAGDLPFVLAEQFVTDRAFQQPERAHVRAENGRDGALAAPQQIAACLIEVLRQDHFPAAQPQVTAAGPVLDGRRGGRRGRGGEEPSAAAYR